MKVLAAQLMKQIYLINYLIIRTEKRKAKKNAYLYLFQVGSRSSTCTMISGRSEEESGRGFARIKEIASSVTVFTIFIFLITREFAAKKTEGEDLNPV